MAYYYNRRHKEGLNLKEGDSVYLLTRNLKIKHKSQKLGYIREGPFQIEARLGKNTYKLKLPKDTQINPVFHIALLELADPETPIQDILQMEPPEEYEVKEIIGSRTRHNEQEYLIKWEGYDSSENTWELIKNLTNCQQLIEDYHQENPVQQRFDSSRDSSDWEHLDPECLALERDDH